MKYYNITNYISESIRFNVVSMQDWVIGEDEVDVLDIGDDELEKQTALFNPAHLGDLGDSIIDIFTNGKIIFSGTKPEIDDWVDQHYKTFNGNLQFSIKGAVIHTMNLAN